MNENSKAETTKQSVSSQMMDQLDRIRIRLGNLTDNLEVRLAPYVIPDLPTKPGEGRLAENLPEYFQEQRKIMWDIEASLTRLESVMERIEL